MNADDVDRVIQCLEDPSQYWSEEVRLEVVEPPSIEFIARTQYRDGVRSMRMVPTAVAGIQFWDQWRGRWEKKGYIRYVAVQFLSCIPWMSDTSYYNDRLFVIEAVYDVQPSRPNRLYRWRLKYKTVLPWYKSPVVSENTTTLSDAGRPLIDFPDSEPSTQPGGEGP